MVSFYCFFGCKKESRIFTFSEKSGSFLEKHSIVPFLPNATYEIMCYIAKKYFNRWSTGTIEPLTIDQR
jgi:hypothetical protein